MLFSIAFGTLELDRDKFIMSAIGSAKTGAPILMNQAGMLSRPVAVRFKLSSSRNTRHSVIWDDVCSLLAVSLIPGAV